MKNDGGKVMVVMVATDAAGDILRFEDGLYVDPVSAGAISALPIEAATTVVLFALGSPWPRVARLVAVEGAKMKVVTDAEIGEMLKKDGKA
jgi:hypothetical protein